MTSPGFLVIREAAIAACEPRGDETVIDLGAGSGFLALALAPRVHRLLAIDIAPPMIEALSQAADALGISVETCIADLRHFDREPASVDLIVSNYALHHLSHRDKQALLLRAHLWLRPGGRLVVADMMFGRGRTLEDRQLLRQKLNVLARKGPGGLWRIVKAAYRYGLGMGTERPASPQFWCRAMTEAGFSDVSYQHIIAEGGLVVGHVGTDMSIFGRISS
jgi:ubiquinone/menaquinone biosynthesis C-methylase UbiE